MGTIGGPLPALGGVLLFFAVLASLELGRVLGRRRHATEPEVASEGAGAVEGAVFGLLGLLVAFTLSGALQRWDHRRDLVVEEANDIGTAWLRLGLLPEASQVPLRELFREYLDARLAAYAAVPDAEGVARNLARANALQQQIWSKATEECLKPEGDRARLLLLPALNAMIDITATRAMTEQAHPPAEVYLLLVGLLLASSLLAGLAMATSPSRNLARMMCFALAMSVGVYVISDLEFPRLGLIRVDAVDQVLRDLRASMK
jgi:hypothetical protein